MKILVLGNAARAGVIEEVEQRLPWLRQHAEVAAVDLHQEIERLPPADLALVFGGDGAILRAARQMAYAQVPVLGVNMGRLGFLADIATSELEERFLQVVAGECRITQHLMYECVAGSRTLLGLNEIVVHTVPPFPILDLDLDVEGQAVTRFSGDGLIVSTPVGSTGHNLSAGGPILGQELLAFVITPICPHTLTYRPVVVGADMLYTIRLAREQAQAMVIVDGQLTIPVDAQQTVSIRAAPVRFRMVKCAGRNVFQTLRNKLHWGTPPNYRGEP